MDGIETTAGCEEPAGERRELPDCYGDPSRVCPRDEDGVMQPQRECVACFHVRRCLQTALQKESVIEPSVAAPAAAKVGGFLKRWSDRKLANAASHGKKGSLGGM
ncbi:MAG: hypothetical protein AB7W37_10090 [Syntrophobacteraceae bacterium]